jgi:hypothetical protein
MSFLRDLTRLLFVEVATFEGTHLFVKKCFDDFTPQIKEIFKSEFLKIQRADPEILLTLFQKYEKETKSSKINHPYSEIDFKSLSSYHEFYSLLSGACIKRWSKSVTEGGLGLKLEEINRTTCCIM